MEASPIISVPADKLIEFTNFINECCAVMDDTQVGEWILLQHGFLNNLTPFEEFNQNGTEKLYRLLYFIDKDEADLID
tara:strand:- start:233 stop:466 length:234 start_codon:yes stop_codon:yes gene_type:complete